MSHHDHLFRRSRRSRATRLVLLGTPLALIAVELGHPVLDAIHPIHMLRPILVEWILIHLLLMPLFAGTAWAFFVLLEGMPGRAASIAKVSICFYSVAAIGYESAVGLGSGMMMLAAEGALSAEQHLLEQMLSRMILSLLFNRMAILISLAGAISILCSIVALWRANAPRLAMVVFAGSLCFVIAHETPFGVLGNFFFFASSLLLEILWSPTSQRPYPTKGEAAPFSTLG